MSYLSSLRVLVPAFDTAIQGDYDVRIPMSKQIAIICAFAIASFCLASFGQDAKSELSAARSATISLKGQSEVGRAIYKKLCAACHGERGQGAEEYRRRLEGDLSLPQLAELIRETMPEEDPGSLSEQAALDVGRFVFEQYYSPIARERNRPARIELTRLTVEQYRQTVFDLMARFMWSRKLDERRGLEGTYVGSSKLWDKKAPQQTRVDRQIDFDFGTEAPIPEIEDPNVFSIRWRGSVWAPETGRYKISIRSEHAVKFWLNSSEPLIDAWVKSDDNDLFSTNVFLVGGRYYPIRLEFNKAKQGVQDKVKKMKPQPASLSLQWRRPHGVMDVIPNQFLVPVEVARQFACSTPFPPDDRSYGWVRGTSVSREWDRATTKSALQASAFVIGQLDALARTKPNAKDRGDKIVAFCHEFVESACRSPLPDDDGLHAFVDAQFATADEIETAVRRIVILTLKSPRFLYRELDARDDVFLSASRLSFGLWDSMPDQRLWKTAEKSELKTEEQVRSEAERMLGDPRATQKLMAFLGSWLQIDTERELNKDTERFPGFDQSALADLRQSLELGLLDVVKSERADYRELMLGDEMYFNSRLAKLFGLDGDFDSSFQSRKLEPTLRAGVMTHPYVLAQFSYIDDSSPIHRGVFIARNVLGIALRPPPKAAAPLPAELHADLTTRERVALQTHPQECMACHQIINPLGFALENFDAVGRFQTSKDNKPIDSKVEFDFGGAEQVEIKSVRQLAEHVLGNEAAQAAFCERLFQFLVGQPMLAYGPTVKADLRQFFVENEFNIKLLAREIMVVSVLKGRESPPDSNISYPDWASRDAAAPTR